MSSAVLKVIGIGIVSCTIAEIIDYLYPGLHFTWFFGWLGGCLAMIYYMRHLKEK
jgi:hypothetical protein